MEQRRISLIAIDGPGAVGKSSTSKAVAKDLAWPCLDTGAMYRATALALLRAHVDLGDSAGMEAALDRLAIRQVGARTYLGEEDVTDLLRTPALARSVSAVAANARVREVLVAQQRRIAGGGNWVVDGRDIGTDVFPNACCKVFLTASMAVRAQRRFLELQAKGTPQPLEVVAAELQRRDLGVTTRAVAPLRKAEDAIELDSSDMTLEKVAALIVDWHLGHGPLPESPS